MTVRTPSIAIPIPTPIPTRPRGRRPRLIGLAAALAVIVVVAAGVGLWQATRGEEAVTPTPEAALPTSPAIPVGASTVAPTYYRVSSPEQAVLVQADIDAVGAYLCGSQSPCPAWSSTALRVLEAGTPEAAARAAELLGVEYHVRLSTGQPDLRVVDLRAPAAGAPPTDLPATSDAQLYQRWQQAQAATGPEPVSHPDGAGATPASRPPNAATSGDLPTDVPYPTP